MTCPVLPAHLGGASCPGAARLGHGRGYDYPRHHAPGWVPQQYRPAEVEGRVYHEPSEHGFEREVGQRMRHRERP